MLSLLSSHPPHQELSGFPTFTYLAVKLSALVRQKRAFGGGDIIKHDSWLSQFQKLTVLLQQPSIACYDTTNKASQLKIVCTYCMNI